jgi:hypothetical protein
MKKTINEAKRMQQLAGIINESQQSEAIDIRQLVKEVIQEFFLNEEEYDMEDETPKPKPSRFRSRFSKEDAEARKQKALASLEYGPTPPTGIAGVTNYLSAIPGVNIYNLAKSSENIDDFIANVIKIAPKLNNPGSVRGLTKYYEMI